MEHRTPPAAVAIVAIALLACSEGPTDPRAPRTTTVAFDVGPLLQSGPGDDAVSVVALARLRVTSAVGATSREAPLGAADATAEFEVTVPDGFARFDADVASNDGTALYVGDDTLTVTSDGFQVAIDLAAVAPVLVVTPGSMEAPARAGVRQPPPFVLANRGVDTVRWSVESVDPPLESCESYPCLRLAPVQGRVPGDEGTLQVSSLNTPAATYRLRLGSAQGSVELLAHAEAASVVEVAVSDPAGSPVPGHRVTLRACSAGSEEGDPGVCVPDESLPPLVRLTGDEGVAVFTGLPEGHWEARPVGSGQQEVVPSATTLVPEPGAPRRLSFTAYPVP